MKTETSALTGDKEILGKESQPMKNIRCINEDVATFAKVAHGFARAMTNKFEDKAKEGKTGWDDPYWEQKDILKQLKAHIDKGDMVDVANFACFAWYHSKCGNIPALASPAPEVTKGASIPRIYTRCPQCGNDTLTVSNGHLLCTWHACSNPVAIEQLASPPQWIPVSERLPKNGEHFILGYRLSENWATSDNFYWPLDIAHSPWTHWHPLAVPPPPPQPKTREQEDEEWFAKWREDHCQFTYHEMLHATLAYARGEKGEK